MLLLLSDVPAPIVRRPPIGNRVAGQEAVSLAIPRFQLLIQRAERSRWADFKDKKALAVVFVGIDCPLANLYVLRRPNCRRRVRPKGLQILAINSNSQDSPDRHCEAR